VEKPILFSTEMVKAILAGRKTMTRRVIKPQPTMYDFGKGKVLAWIGKILAKGYTAIGVQRVVETPSYLKCPYGQPCDILWVRETWCEFVPEHIINGQRYAYKASTDEEGERCRQDYIQCRYPYKWKPSIHMPREACRLFLKVMSIRVERLQDIGLGDCYAEGCPEEHERLPKEWFKNIWESTIKKQDFVKYGWDVNPWVWVVEFERVEVKGA
jgi:hypothetical protein